MLTSSICVFPQALNITYKLEFALVTAVRFKSTSLSKAVLALTAFALVLFLDIRSFLKGKRNATLHCYAVSTMTEEMLWNRSQWHQSKCSVRICWIKHKRAVQSVQPDVQTLSTHRTEITAVREHQTHQDFIPQLQVCMHVSHPITYMIHTWLMSQAVEDEIDGIIYLDNVRMRDVREKMKCVRQTAVH